MKMCNHVRKDVNGAIKQLLDDDVIECATGPTPWISPVVIVPNKDKSVRVCVDMRKANQAIQRNKHPMPTIEEVITDLDGATVFSTLDLKAGYHQCTRRVQVGHNNVYNPFRIVQTVQKIDVWGKRRIRNFPKCSSANFSWFGRMSQHI